ncbi:MAG: rhomboid family intramembrane serine protease [Anaerolineales bacterium]|nr:rhomboid family intramembrane serine protease [Anaerolineales bacterium]MCB8953529.1 rhomboid family intramembrane serine protease [Ardenticatenales bacterium]
MIPLRDANPTRQVPVVTLTLIVINVAVWLWELTMQVQGQLNAFVMTWAVVPAQLLQNPLAELPTLLTAMFLHGSWGHLLGNMLYLWIFGDNIEDQLGRSRFLLFYFLTGLAATMTQTLIDPNSTLPNVGASGAIAGIMGGYLLLFPSARILTLVGYFFVRVPAVLVLIFWFGIQLFGGFGSLNGWQQDGGVAFFAHIGGFVAGIILIRLFIPRRGRTDYDQLPPF